MSSSSLLVITMSGRKMGMIAVISHVENGGHMDMEGVSDLRPGAGSRDRYSCREGGGSVGAVSARVAVALTSSVAY